MTSKNKIESKFRDLEGSEPEGKEVKITVAGIPEGADPENYPDPIHLELEK